MEPQHIRQILGDKQGGLDNSFKSWSLCSPSQKTSRSIAHVRCIKILTGLRGFNCKYFKIPLSEETWTQRNPNQIRKNDPTASESC